MLGTDQASVLNHAQLPRVDGYASCCMTTDGRTGVTLVVLCREVLCSELHSSTVSVVAHYLVVSRCARICLISCMHSAEPL